MLIQHLLDTSNNVADKCVFLQSPNDAKATLMRAVREIQLTERCWKAQKSWGDKQSWAMTLELVASWRESDTFHAHKNIWSMEILIPATI